MDFLQANIIVNHDFAKGLLSWHPNSCNGFVSDGSNYAENIIKAETGACYAVLSNRTQSWQGLEQDITPRLLAHATYNVSAFVRIFGSAQLTDTVLATLKLENPDSPPTFVGVGRVAASKERWEKLEGTFSLKSMPYRAIFYLEGPSAGVDLLIDRVHVWSADGDLKETKMDEMQGNIIVNHDFSKGLLSWHPNSCNGFVSDGSNYAKKIIKAETRSCYAVLSNRTQCWQGLEQDITPRLLPHVTYNVLAFVRVWGSAQVTDNVLATLKLENPNSSPTFVGVGRVVVSKGRWEKLEGTFFLKSMPYRAIFYLERPSPGVDLLIDSVHVWSADANFKEKAIGTGMTGVGGNIILNPNFDMGIHGWCTNSCGGYVYSDSAEDSKTDSNMCAVIYNRTDCWQGLEQDITTRLMPNLNYNVLASVRIEGTTQSISYIQATLRLENTNSSPTFLALARVQASNLKWEKLQGTFSLEVIPDRAIFYLEGPPAGVNLMVKSVDIRPDFESNSFVSTGQYQAPSESCLKREAGRCFIDGDEKIIQNPLFEDGLNLWSGRGCKIFLHDVMGNGDILPSEGWHFASATDRMQAWQGIQQDIAGRLKRKTAYEVSAAVRIFGNIATAEVLASLWIQTRDLREQYITIGKVQASTKGWLQLQGKFLLNTEPSKAIAYLEGPPPGIDILVDSFSLHPAKKPSPASPPVIENPAFGQNILENSNLFDGLREWYPLGSCLLKVCTGSPSIFPPTAEESLGCQRPLSGCYILATNRKQTWEGPAQTITERLKLFLTYQVSAWVRVGYGGHEAQKINIALSVDNKWVNGGEVEGDAQLWREVAGSFRLETKPSKVMVHVQGPSPGVDLMVAGLQIFAVDRKARFEHLKKEAQKVRMRDVIVKLSGSHVKKLSGLSVKVKQIDSSFPLGACINRCSLDNEDYVDFFIKNFNWAVFDNELKWGWTESQRGKFNYVDADELCQFCNCHGIQMRGHCIFWEDEHAVQPWLKELNGNELKVAVQNRIVGLLSRYDSKFQHYDVNNEMLHGSFYQDRLGKEIWPYMFKMAHQFDPAAALFVNDYHVEDGCDAQSTPEKYIDQILNLQEQGAPIGGIGVQGHVTSPVGAIICSGLNRMAILGLPIWFTEVDVSSENEFIRADDLEVILREAFAHPAIEGIMLWGFWELAMCREQAHLVDADGFVNETGKRFLALKEEWKSNLEGCTDHEGQFRFRAFHGTYKIEVSLPSKKLNHEFIVEKGDSVVVVDISL